MNMKDGKYKKTEQKNLQWKPTPEESRNANPISSKKGLHSIEMSIENEAI